MREVCLDTETTGLETKSGDRVTEVGCVEIIDRKITGNTFREIINPNRKNSLESIEITGLTDEILADKPFFAEVAPNLLEFIGDSTIIAHNATFDMHFLNFEFGLLGMDPLKNKVIDSLTLAKIKFPGKKNNLDILCERFNVDNTRREKHGALLDAELLAEVYLCLTQEEQSQFFKELKENASAMDIESLLNLIKSRNKLASRDFKISESEIALHNAFVEKNLKDSVWSKLSTTDNSN